MGVTTGYIYRYGPQSFTFLYEKWVGFMTAALLMSITQGIACYAASFIPGKLLALGGNSGNPIYDVCPFIRLPARLQSSLPSFSSVVNLILVSGHWTSNPSMNSGQVSSSGSSSISVWRANRLRVVVV